MAIANVKEGEFIQIMRRGYFRCVLVHRLCFCCRRSLTCVASVLRRCDRPYRGESSPLVLFQVPDGKKKAMSTLSTKLSHR